jgi:HK97 family phage portal protein
MAYQLVYGSGTAAAAASLPRGWERLKPASRPEPVSAPTGGPVQAYSTWDIDDPRLAQFLRDGNVSSTGVSVNAHVALRNPTFFRAINLIAGAVGMLPLHLMQQDEDGTNKAKARQHPLFRVLHRRPNKFQTAFEFKAYLQSVALMDGNAYAYVVRSGRRVIGLVPMVRHSVTPRLTADLMDVEFVYNRPRGGAVTLSSREVFHFRHPVTLDGINGVSLLRMAADTIGIASVAQRAAGKLFKNGSFAPGVLETDNVLGDDVHKRLKDDWEELYSGVDNAGNWPILEQGLKAKSLSPNARESQHLETRQHEAEEIARFTGAPRPLLMFDETSWGSGIEQLGQMFVTYCLMPWFVAWEQAVERILEPDEEDRFYAKFNAGALLRGSMKDQAEFFAKALGSGGSAPWMTQNEVRDNFDTNPKDGGDELPERAVSSVPAPTEPNPPPRKKKDS